MALTKEKKQQQVAKIKEKFDDASLVVFADYRGLTVADIDELRGQLRELNSEFNIYKNTLATLAMADLNITQTGEILSGPTGFVRATEDPSAVAKIIKKYTKAHENVTIKGGIFENKLVEGQVVEQLAELPSRDELIAKTVGSIKAPITNLVMNLSSPIRGLVYTLKAIQDKK